MFAQRGFDVVGLDVTTAMLQIARSRMAGRCLQADCRCLPFRDAIFGGVWASASLLHLAKGQVKVALSEVRRVLRTGGAFYSSVKGGDADGLMVTTRDVRLPRQFAHYRREEWTALLGDAGFAVEEFTVDNPDAIPPDTPWLAAYATVR